MRSIFNLYYTVWVDCITRIRSFDSFWWQFKSMSIMTFAMGVSMMVFMSILQNIVGLYFYNLDLKGIFIKPVASLISSFILFFLPFLLLNYFFIFHNKKYEKLILVYEYHNGKYAMTFFFSVMLIALLCFALIIVLGNVN